MSDDIDNIKKMQEFLNDFKSVEEAIVSLNQLQKKLNSDMNTFYEAADIIESNFRINDRCAKERDELTKIQKKYQSVLDQFLTFLSWIPKTSEIQSLIDSLRNNLEQIGVQLNYCDSIDDAYKLELDRDCRYIFRSESDNRNSTSVVMDKFGLSFIGYENNTFEPPIIKAEVRYIDSSSDESPISDCLVSSSEDESYREDDDFRAGGLDDGADDFYIGGSDENVCGLSEHHVEPSHISSVGTNDCILDTRPDKEYDLYWSYNDRMSEERICTFSVSDICNSLCIKIDIDDANGRLKFKFPDNCIIDENSVKESFAGFILCTNDPHEITYSCIKKKVKVLDGNDEIIFDVDTTERKHSLIHNYYDRFYELIETESSNGPNLNYIDQECKCCVVIRSNKLKSNAITIEELFKDYNKDEFNVDELVENYLSGKSCDDIDGFKEYVKDIIDENSKKSTSMILVLTDGRYKKNPNCKKWKDKCSRLLYFLYKVRK